MGETYLGDVRAMSFDFAPHGWARCNGQLMSTAQNPALFHLLGNRYGGDGKTSFALPALTPVPAQNGAALGYCIALQGLFPTN